MWRYKLLRDALRNSNVNDYVIVPRRLRHHRKSALELVQHHEEQCELHGLDVDSTLFVAPEHHKEWCSWAFEHTLRNASKMMFHVPIANSYVINAGAVMGKRFPMLRYVEKLQTYAHENAIIDDQRALNTLYCKKLIDPDADGFAIHVDLTCGFAYCHANRHMGRCVISQCINHNRHRIKHERDLDLSVASTIVLRHRSRKIGVLHAICNADIDQLCVHLDLPVAQNVKPISQPSLRAGMITFKCIVFLSLIALSHHHFFPLWLRDFLTHRCSKNFKKLFAVSLHNSHTTTIHTSIHTPPVVHRTVNCSPPTTPHPFGPLFYLPGSTSTPSPLSRQLTSFSTHPFAAEWGRAHYTPSWGKGTSRATPVHFFLWFLHAQPMAPVNWHETSATFEARVRTRRASFSLFYHETRGRAEHR